MHAWKELTLAGSFPQAAKRAPNTPSGSAEHAEADVQVNHAEADVQVKHTEAYVQVKEAGVQVKEAGMEASPSTDLKEMLELLRGSLRGSSSLDETRLDHGGRSQRMLCTGHWDNGHLGASGRFAPRIPAGAPFMSPTIYMMERRAIESDGLLRSAERSQISRLRQENEDARDRLEQARKQEELDRIYMRL